MIHKVILAFYPKLVITKMFALKTKILLKIAEKDFPLLINQGMKIHYKCKKPIWLKTNTFHKIAQPFILKLKLDNNKTMKRWMNNKWKKHTIMINKIKINFWNPT